MSDKRLNLHLTDHASIAFTSLGEEDRRVLSGWFDHLRDWNTNSHVRDRSKPLDAKEGTFVLWTASDLGIAFRLTARDVTVLSIFRKESLRPFEVTAGRAAS